MKLVSISTKAQLIQSTIARNTKRIVNDCQSYLDAYAAGQKPQYSTDLDFLLSQLFHEENSHNQISQDKIQSAQNLSEY